MGGADNDQALGAGRVPHAKRECNHPAVPRAHCRVHMANSGQVQSFRQCVGLVIRRHLRGISASRDVIDAKNTKSLCVDCSAWTNDIFPPPERWIQAGRSDVPGRGDAAEYCDYWRPARSDDLVPNRRSFSLFGKASVTSGRSRRLLRWNQCDGAHWIISLALSRS